MRAALLLLLFVGLGGCTGDAEVKEFQIHIGWNDDGTQYLTPSEIRVHEGDKVRFVVTNDDERGRDYNGDKPGNDNFHDVALLDYDGDGDGIKEDIEHEVPAGTTVTTSFKGQDYFVASEKGTFEIICEVRTQPTHAELGMRGTFIVE